MLGDCSLPPYCTLRASLGSCFDQVLQLTLVDLSHTQYHFGAHHKGAFSRLVPSIHKMNLSCFTHTISEATIAHAASPLALYIHQLTASTSAIPVYFGTLVKVSELIFQFWKDQKCQILFHTFYKAQLTPHVNCMLTWCPHAQLLKIVCCHQCSCHHQLFPYSWQFIWHLSSQTPQCHNLWYPWCPPMETMECHSLIPPSHVSYTASSMRSSFSSCDLM